MGEIEPAVGVIEVTPITYSDPDLGVDDLECWIAGGPNWEPPAYCFAITRTAQDQDGACMVLDEDMDRFAREVLEYGRVLVFTNPSPREG